MDPHVSGPAGNPRLPEALRRALRPCSVSATQYSLLRSDLGRIRRRLKCHGRRRNAYARPGACLRNGRSARSVADRGIPDAFGFVPNRFAKASIESQIRSKAVTLDAALQVVVDFLLARIHAGPFR